MKAKTTFLPKEQLRSEALETIEKIENIYSKTNVVLHEDLYPIKKSSYHFIGQMLKRMGLDSRVSRAITANLFKSIYQAEINSAGSAQIAMLFAVNFAKRLLKETDILLDNEHEVQNRFEEITENFKNHMQESAKIPTEKDLKHSIRKVCEYDEVLTEVVWNATNLAGLEGKIFVEDGKQQNYLVEVKEGFHFKLKPFKFMLDHNSWERKKCKVLIVDGLLENVSEIDHLLNKCLETKQPLAIIAMGFSEEIAATLKANKDKGLLDVQPIRIPSDLQSLNIVNDISVACGTLPVSSFKGDLISLVNYEDLVEVDKIRAYEDLCVIENSGTRGAVAEQIKMILEKREENFMYEDIQNLMDQRIRSLVSNSSNIVLPDISAARNDEIRVKIDLALRECKSILNYGMVDFVQASKSFYPSSQKEDRIDKAFRNALLKTTEEIEESYIPSLSAIIGCKLAGKSILMMLCSSGMVEITC